jgi:CRISPR system Cascade subunit CasC
MTLFIQAHLLVAYPPANLNRDDTGRPKTAMLGNHPRLRISSQSLKRAWRTSTALRDALAGHLGERTQRLGAEVEKRLIGGGLAVDKARAIAIRVADLFGKPKGEKDKNPTYIEQLAFVSPEERRKAFELADRLAAGEEVKLEASEVLRTADSAADIAAFGRMLADDPAYNCEAAVQVAHAVTTHKAVVEDDYYTAVDDLKLPSEDAGAGFIGETGFGAGVFYLYICIDRDLLIRNLGGDAALADRTVEAILRAAATVGPSGKQASFASRARASYLMVEHGEATPRTLVAAFLKPANGEDVLASSIGKLEATRANFAKAYGDDTACAVMNAHAGEGSLEEVLRFARGQD